MASTQVNPTRMELTRLKKKLGTAIKGHRLLKDKRDELMREFLDMVRVNMELREKVEKEIKAADLNFVLAKSTMSEETLQDALMAPKQEVQLSVDKRNVMSVDIPVFDYTTRTADANDIYSYGFAFTSADLDDAVGSLAAVFPDMLKLAEVEKSCQLMAAEIEKTRRRVNALEHVIIPETQQGIRYITMKIHSHFKPILPLGSSSWGKIHLNGRLILPSCFRKASPDGHEPSIIPHFLPLQEQDSLKTQTHLAILLSKSFVRWS